VSREPVTIEAMCEVHRILDQHAIPHAFVGGLALNAWGIPRATFDIDLCVVLGPGEQPRLLEALRQLVWSVDETFQRGWRDQMAGIPVIHAHSPVEGALVRVDLMVADTPFLRSVIERRASVDLGPASVPVCSAADLVLFKVLADREKDRMDVRNVLTVQGVPERAYLERWAGELGIRERLARFMPPSGA
jgi:Nucleotidyl transferase AbiEii toxin, Type IV TA system